MAQVRNRRRSRQEPIALISRLGVSMRESKSRDTFYPPLFRSIVKHAEAHGYGVDEFYLGRGRLSDARLSGILRARGIHGVLFFPGAAEPGKDYPELSWDDFATVLIGFNTLHEKLHQVVSDYSYDIDCALRHIQAQSVKRIGFAVTRGIDQSTNHHWSSRFLFYQSGLPKPRRVPLLLADSDLAFRRDLVDWYERHRPEAILIAGGSSRTLLLRAGIRIPEDVKLVNLVQRGEPNLAGIDPHTDEVGHAAVELLVSLLQTNQSGLPPFPRTISIKGHWVPGASFPGPSHRVEVQP
jgi:LacI family transcriptional regulator